MAKLANFPEGVINDARRRISQLEGNNPGESGEDGRSFQTEGEGEKIISDFLSKLQGLQDVSDDELVDSFTAIREDFCQSNSFVKSLLI